jgi:hypothetical protein
LIEKAFTNLLNLAWIYHLIFSYEPSLIPNAFKYALRSPYSLTTSALKFNKKSPRIGALSAEQKHSRNTDKRATVSISSSGTTEIIAEKTSLTIL